MTPRLAAVLALWLGVFCAAPAQDRTYDRVASVGQGPTVAETGPAGDRGSLIDILRALDRVTRSSTRIVVRPFARSLLETAAGRADFHVPLIQFDNAPPPAGLAYVEEVDFGRVQFVIYSRKDAPIDAIHLDRTRVVEVQAGHEGLLPFPANESNCIPCTLDKILIGRVDALVSAIDIVDPLLRDPRYKNIRRAQYKAFLVRALVPVNVDSSATRRYLIDGITELKKSGELRRLSPSSDRPYVDWQP